MGLIFHDYTYNVEIVLKNDSMISGTVRTGFSRDSWLNDTIFSEEWVTIYQGDKKTAIRTKDITYVSLAKEKEE